MSKLLKVIVNTLLLLAILSAGALVIPPFAGITTLVSDGMGNTNISRGAVTYAKKTDTSSVATGDKILVDDNSGKYIYTIQSLDIAAGTASVKNVISGDTTEITVRATVSKVIVTIPVIGFLSMAAQSREGIMIIGLAILFLVILFILSEVWKRDEEEDEEEEEEDEDEDDEKASEELRSRKKAALEEKKKREEQEMIEQLRAADQKTAEEEKQDEFEIPDLEEEETEQVSFHTVDLQNLVRGEETEEIPEAGTNAVGEKRRDPVRIEKRRKIFRAQIVLDQHIHHSRDSHHGSGNDPSALTASADPEKAGQQQKQKHVRPHQGQQYRDNKHGSQLALCLLIQIGKSQPVKQDQHAKADDLRHTGQHVSGEQCVQAEKYRQNAQLFPGGFHQPYEHEHADRQQYNITDHR